jgi:hypothetical protein
LVKCGTAQQQDYQPLGRVLDLSTPLLLTRSCMISAIRAKAGELLIPEIIPAADGPHALLPFVQHWHCSTIAEDQGVNDEST